MRIHLEEAHIKVVYIINTGKLGSSIKVTNNIGWLLIQKEIFSTYQCSGMILVTKA